VVTVNPSPPLVVDDDGYAGPIASMKCVALDMVDQGYQSVQAVEVTSAISHAWIGDLTIKLVSPLGTVTTLVSRPGLDEPADDGSSAGAFGANANLVAASPITFRDGASHDAELMGSTLGDDEAVCLDDGQCAFQPNPGTGPGTSLADFDGEDPVGTWQLCAGDSATPDAGAIHSVTLSVLAL
jgi:subtilisin-like proprotein convertase family protein